MGTIEIDASDKIITISSNIICYGNAANYDVTAQIAAEIEMMWNEPNGIIEIHNTTYFVRFNITSQYYSFITAKSIIENQNRKNNYIRIEEFSKKNISFVDAIGSNSGYFLLANLYKGSTTAAHEFGHSLGLLHPTELNIIGKGRPSIMYPRGSLVDQEFQNDVTAQPAGPGGTLNPQNRKVMQVDIDNLQLKKLIENEIFMIGKFTNKYHDAHVKENT